MEGAKYQKKAKTVILVGGHGHFLGDCPSSGKDMHCGQCRRAWTHKTGEIYRGKVFEFPEVKPGETINHRPRHDWGRR